MTLAELRNEYRPYDRLPAFNLGFAAYQEGRYNNPFDSFQTPSAGRDAQAWDRGLARTDLRPAAGMQTKTEILKSAGISTSAVSLTFIICPASA